LACEAFGGAKHQQTARHQSRTHQRKNQEVAADRAGRVDLPEPLAPRRPKISPCRTVSETSSTATTLFFGGGFTLPGEPQQRSATKDLGNSAQSERGLHRLKRGDHVHGKATSSEWTTESAAGRQSSSGVAAEEVENGGALAS
jgi:hypothetical protein